MSIAAPHLETEIFLLSLVNITFVNEITNAVEVDLRFQNSYKPDYSWRGKVWTYLPFEITSINYSTEIDVADASLLVPNITMIRDPLRQFDGLRKGIVRAYSIFPEINPDLARQDVFQISHPVFNYTTIEFTLQNPLNGINGEFPTRVFEGSLFRELPLRQGNSF